MAVLADVVLIRAHALKETYTGIATGAGFVAGTLAIMIWYGTSLSGGRAHVVTRQRRQLLSARTITGVRTIDLGVLSGVRRYEAAGKFGQVVDELRLRDRHGVRLAVDADAAAVRAVLKAIEAAGAQPDDAQIKVTRHSRSRLGLEPRSSVPQLVHQFAGVFIMCVALMAPAVGTYLLARVLV